MLLHVLRTALRILALLKIRTPLLSTVYGWMDGYKTLTRTIEVNTRIKGPITGDFLPYCKNIDFEDIFSGGEVN